MTPITARREHLIHEEDFSIYFIQEQMNVLVSTPVWFQIDDNSAKIGEWFVLLEMLAWGCDESRISYEDIFGK